MSSPFNDYLVEIADDYSSSPTRQEFKKIKEFVVWRLRTYNNNFNSYFKESIFCGPSAHGTQLYEDRHKQSVILVLETPSYTNIKLYDNNDEYKMLDVTNVPHNLPMEDDCNYINRWYLQQWMEEIFEKVFEDTPECYGFTLSYELRGMRHTIFANCGSDELIINFVPAIALNLVIKKYPKIGEWHAIPKLMPGSQANYSFMVSNTKLENYLIQDEDLRKALILVQVLCRKKGLTKIHYYHLLNLVISKEIEDYASDHSLQYIFIEILRELYNAINAEHLPHMWNSSIDLLSKLSQKDLTDYETILGKAYDTLVTYPDQERLSYERCCDHFEY